MDNVQPTSNTDAAIPMLLIGLFLVIFIGFNYNSGMLFTLPVANKYKQLFLLSGLFQICHATLLWELNAS